MVDTNNLVKWIPLLFLMFSVFFIVSSLYISGLMDLSKDIGEYDRGKFRLAVVLENTVTLSDSPGNPGIDYEHRRGAIPSKFFTNSIGTTDVNKVGYHVRDDHCHIPRVSGLDGENFGFAMPKTTPISINSNCEIRGSPTDKEYISTQIMIINRSLGKFHNEKFSSKIYIYEIN